MPRRSHVAHAAPLGTDTKICDTVRLGILVFGRGIGTNLQRVEAAAVVMRGWYRGPALVYDALEGAARLLARANAVIE